MTSKQLSNEEIRQIQLEILDAVHNFCVNNSITYFLTGGTLIGAIRHGGYIPWDDDIDIMMYRNEYNNFINLFNKNNKRFHVYSIENDKGYNYHFAKICDMDTILEETNIKINDVVLGVNIDLFPLDKLPEKTNESFLLDELHAIDKKMYGLSFKLDRLSSKPLKQRLLILMYRLSGLMTSREKLGLKQSQIAQQFVNSNTSIYGLITCQARNKFPKIDRNITIPQKHLFEDRFYYIPSTYDVYLREQFGDYMIPPPKEKRTSGHSFICWKK